MLSFEGRSLKLRVSAPHVLCANISKDQMNGTRFEVGGACRVQETPKNRHHFSLGKQVHQFCSDFYILRVKNMVSGAHCPPPKGILQAILWDAVPRFVC
jgi:hypothetical protein